MKNSEAGGGALCRSEAGAILSEEVVAMFAIPKRKSGGDSIRAAPYSKRMAKRSAREWSSVTRF